MMYLDIAGWLHRNPVFLLLPVNHLEKFSESDGCGFEWHATGDDPAFKVKCKKRFPVGWYMLTVKVKADCTRLAGKLYLDYGKGIVETDAIRLPLTAGKTLKRICYFPELPVAMRFDPAENICRFSIDSFSMSKLTAGYARQLMLKKLNARRSTELDSSLSLDAIYQDYQQLFEPCQTAVTYPQWVTNHEGRYFGEENIARLWQQIKCKPLFSVLVTTYNTQETFLRACIESVLQQSYDHWKLCIADDASTNEQVRDIIREYASQDKRIKTVFRETNGHISVASNSALKLAGGEYIALLDHDDVLAKHALLLMAATINDHPDAKLIYSDEDKIDEQGRRFEPHFKSDWNRDLFYSHNYITHLSVLDRSLVKAVGGFRSSVEGSQDYDLLLRCIARVGNREIVHIPHILYHWRAIEGSTALTSSAKDYTTEAGLKALQDFFAATPLDVKVTKSGLANCYRVIWPLPVPAPLVSLLIPTRDGYALLKQCIESIVSKTTYAHYEIVVLNNQTACQNTLKYFEVLKRSPNIRVVDYDQPFNYSAMNNMGAAHARGTILGLINNDIEVISPEWLDEMVRQVSRPDIGCVGAKLLYPDDRIQHAGVVLGIGGVAGHSHKYFSNQNPGYFSRLRLTQNYSAVTAAAMLVRKSVFEEVGGLEENHLRVAFNDIDFCLKVREAGYRNLWTPYAELYHHESVSRGHEDTPEKQARFRKEIEFMQGKWGEQLSCDPCYSPNLTLMHEDFSYRMEP